MGECGCSEIQQVAGLFRVRDFCMVVEIYTGCEYCQTGLAVGLYAFTEDEARELFFEETDKEFSPSTVETAVKNIPIVDQSDLLAALADLPPLEEGQGLREWLEENGRDLLQEAAYIRMKETFREDA